MGQDDGGDDRKIRSQQSIEENLKKIYQADMAEEIPVRFHLLLEKLRNSESDGAQSAPSKRKTGGAYDK